MNYNNRSLFMFGSRIIRPKKTMATDLSPVTYCFNGTAQKLFLTHCQTIKSYKIKYYVVL